jgi:hypothetical protein
MNAKFTKNASESSPEFAIIKNASPTNPTGFQTGIVSGFGADLAVTMDKAISFGVSFLELSNQDLTEANKQLLIEKTARLRKAYD